MEPEDPPAETEIVTLEDVIADLADRRERSRKLMRLARLMIAAGSILIAGVLTGLLRTGTTGIIGGFALLFAGLTLLGSSRGSFDDAEARIAAAEARRRSLIDHLGLPSVRHPPVPGELPPWRGEITSGDVKNY